MENKLAIITGASSGLGRAYAIALASTGWDLLITGRRVERLSLLKQEILSKYAVKVKIVIADFTIESQFDNLLSEINCLQNVGLLVNNAGFGSRKGFFVEEYKTQQKMLQVHINATSRLIYEVVPKMIMNKGGAVINVSSLSAFFPSPLNYFYCASKAFLLSFSECLHIDLIDKNIKIQALCPGFVKTEFHSRIHQQRQVHNWKEKIFWMNPDVVVKQSLKNLNRKKVVCIPGFVNRVLYLLSAIVPKRLYYFLMGKNAQSANHMHYKKLLITKRKLAYS